MPQAQLKVGRPTFFLTSYLEEDVAHKGSTRTGTRTQDSSLYNKNPSNHPRYVVFEAVKTVKTVMTFPFCSHFFL